MLGWKMRRRLVILGIVTAIVIIFGLSFFVMPVTSVSIMSENIEMSENLVIEASAFYLSPIPLITHCGRITYTVSWWNENEGEWVRVFDFGPAECMCSFFYLNEDCYLTWSPEEHGWAWLMRENIGKAKPGHYKIDIEVIRDDYEFEFYLENE